MGLKFWLIRALKFFITVTIILFIIELLKQHSVLDSLSFAVTWSFITTAIFIGSRIYQSRKGVECALCNDTPDASNEKSNKN